MSFYKLSFEFIVHLASRVGMKPCIYPLSIFACYIIGTYSYWTVLNFPRPPVTAAPVVTVGADGNILSIERLVQDMHEYTHLPAGWDGCMKYKCNDEENCLETSTDGSTLPCCEELLHRMAVDIDRLLKSYNALSFPFSGTLLGIIREGSVMPNNVTADVDFLVDSDTFQDIYIKPMGFLLRYAFYSLGYHMFADGSDLGRVCFRKNGRNLGLGLQEDDKAVHFNLTHGQDNWKYYNFYKYGDLYRTENRNNNSFFIFASENFPQGLRFDDIYPLRPVRIKDHVFEIPLQTEDMLTVMYGNWSQVIKQMHH